MPSSINSTSSSPGGLIASGDTDNELVIQTDDTTAISIDASQNVTIANQLSVTNQLTSNDFYASSGFYTNTQTITANYTLASTSNAMSAGPITVDSGVTVTIDSGSRWVVI
jgi:hypothetical protein